MKKFLLLTFALAALGFFSGGCSALSPKVGPEQDASTCGASSSSTSPYGGYPSSSSSSGDAGSCGAPARDPRCVADAGYEQGDCDHCQDIYCCTQRFQCYDDPACFNADEDLDKCVESAESSDAGDVTAARVACWSTFVDQPGPLGTNIRDCEAQYCKDVCGVP